LFKLYELGKLDAKYNEPRNIVNGNLEPNKAIGNYAKFRGIGENIINISPFKFGNP